MRASTVWKTALYDNKLFSHYIRHSIPSLILMLSQQFGNKRLPDFTDQW